MDEPCHCGDSWTAVAALAERVVADHPNVSADDMATATAALGPFLRAQERSDVTSSRLQHCWMILALSTFAVSI